MRAIRLAIALAVLVPALAGCGRKGALEPALDPGAPAAATSAGDAVAPSLRHSRPVPITPSKDPFVLDPLL